MELTLPQVAHLFDVTENVIAVWIREENLPVETVNSQYRFHRAELLEWASLTNRKCSPTIFHEVNGDHIGELSLADALEYGGVLHDIAGNTKQSVLSAVLSGMPMPEGFDCDSLLELLLTRESLCSSGVGDGIAIPHPRYPVVLSLPGPAVRLCFLAQPLDFQSHDGKPVDKLFVMICPTVHCHLQLLALLASALRDDRFRAVLGRRARRREIVESLRQIERSLHQPELITS